MTHIQVLFTVTLSAKFMEKKLWLNIPPHGKYEVTLLSQILF